MSGKQFVRKRVEQQSYDTVISTNPGASTTVTIIPPDDEVWYVRNMSVYMNVITGATTGTHGLYFTVGSINSGHWWLGSTTGNYNVPLTLANKATIGSNHLDIVVSTKCPLIIYYNNVSDVALNNATLYILIAKEIF